MIKFLQTDQISYRLNYKNYFHLTKERNSLDILDIQNSSFLLLWLIYKSISNLFAFEV
jgi:hypothetical protein